MNDLQIATLILASPFLVMSAIWAIGFTYVRYWGRTDV